MMPPSRHGVARVEQKVHQDLIHSDQIRDHLPEPGSMSRNRSVMDSPMMGRSMRSTRLTTSFRSIGLGVSRFDRG